jgi:RNA polymerase II subunit A C-terminal domain phosphatase SSU72
MTLSCTVHVSNDEIDRVSNLFQSHLTGAPFFVFRYKPTMPPATVLHRPSTPPGVPPPEAYRPPHHGKRLSFGVVCSSNINRSMEAHLVLQNAGLHVDSYGTGSTVRLPGKTAMEPRIFKFGTPYKDIYAQLAAIDADFFSKNKVLGLCQRGAAVKTSATRWQDADHGNRVRHDVVVCFEERIYDAVIEDLLGREPTSDMLPVHVVCLDTKDNPHEAQLQGRVCLDLCWRLEHCPNDLQQDAPYIIDEFQKERESFNPIKILYQVCYL